MQDHRSSAWDSMLNIQSPPRIAVVGGGIAGLTCARELRLRGCEPVVFEANDRLGGRCSSRSTRVGLFDDAAQCIGGATRLAIHVVQAPAELAAPHPWTVAATPAEEERNSKGWTKDDDETDVTRTLKLKGAAGVPSMVALAMPLVSESSELCAAMHSKPGRLASGPRRWSVEAEDRWSFQHAHEDAETIDDLLLDNFRAHAGRPVTPNFLQAYEWRHPFVGMPATTPRRTERWWDNKLQLGVCGDSVVPSQVDRVHRSDVDMARALAEGLTYRSGRSSCSAVDQDLGQLLEAYL